jgi:hypothetical protein
MPSLTLSQPSSQTLSHSPNSRLTRRLIKLASLGLAGLLAGLLSGCTISSTSTDAYEAPAARTSSDWEFTSSTTPTAPHSSLSRSIDARQIPALHHSPSARRLQQGELTTIHQSSPTRYSNRS